MKIVALIVALVLLALPARAQTEARAPKLNGYGTLEAIDGRAPKLNGYGVLHGIQAQAPKLAAYGVLTACVAVPKLIGYGVLESAENVLRELILPKPAHAQWWPLMGGIASSPGPCR